MLRRAALAPRLLALRRELVDSSNANGGGDYTAVTSKGELGRRAGAGGKRVCDPVAPRRRSQSARGPRCAWRKPLLARNQLNAVTAFGRRILGSEPDARGVQRLAPPPPRRRGHSPLASHCAERAQACATLRHGVSRRRSEAPG